MNKKELIFWCLVAPGMIIVILICSPIIVGAAYLDYCGEIRERIGLTRWIK